LTVIEPGIDTRVFSATSTVTDPLPLPLPADWRGRRVLLMPGRGTRLKGHDTAIRLLASLRDAGVDAGLWLLGCVQPGREAYVEELRGLASALEVSGRVQFSAPSERIVEAYRGADLVLQLSSRPEAFGRTVLESLAAGAPVIGWDHGGVGELLARHFPQGRVAPGDQAALLATTLGLLSSHQRPAAIHPQSLADAQAQTLNVYQSLIG
jgi:glycosyltransferase involved in cell wall biosynthesis